MAEQHYCQRVLGEAYLSLTSVPDAPKVCGKPARFSWNDPSIFLEEGEPSIWWLCAECYDDAVARDLF